jgi:transposase
MISGTITMALREVDRMRTVQAVCEGHLRQVLAAERLGMTARQIRRLVRRYQAEGPLGLLSRLRGQPSNRRMPAERAQLALELIRAHYADFGPTLATEKLRERHSLTLAKETVRQMMIATGLWIPRKLRPPVVHQPRQRRSALGELIQIDGCEHHWFEDRGPACTALVYVDDATGRLMQLSFVPAESTFSYFGATRAYLEQHGKPMALYSDKAGIFRVNRPSATGGDGHTQFARALFELGIVMMCANTPQAKGRVERAHQTLQDRMVKEFRLQGISTPEAANAFAEPFIAEYNARFARVPRRTEDAHRPLRPEENLESIFTWREPRSVSRNLTVQYDKRLYLLTDSALARRFMGKYIEVWEYPDGRVQMRGAGQRLPYEIYDRLAQIDQGAIVDNKRLGAALRAAQFVQAKRDNRRSAGSPSRSHLTGETGSRRRKLPGTKGQRQLDENDLKEALNLLKVAARPQAGGYLQPD